MHSFPRVPRWRSYLLAIIATALAAGLREFLMPWLGFDVPLALFAVSTITVAAIGGFGPGILAMVLSALVAVYFFMPPRGTIRVERPADLARLCVFLVACTLVSIGVGAIKQLRRRALASARRAAELQARARDEAIARESASAALQDTRCDFLAVFDYAAVGMVQSDPQSGRLLRVNQKFCDMLGFTEAEMEGKTFSDLTHADDRERDRAAFSKVLADAGTEHAMEKRFVRKDGELLWAYVSARVVRSSSASARMVFSAVVDITERKRAERELRERESQLRQIGDNLPEGFLYQLVARPDGTRKFLFFSAGIEQITGVPAREAMADARSIYSLLHPEDVPMIAAKESECLRSLKEFDVVARSLHLGTGEWRWAQIRSAPRAMPNGDVIWDGVYLDITAAKRTQEELDYSIERLNLAQRAGHIGVFDWQIQTGKVIWNDEEHRIFGLEPGTFVGRIEGWEERVHPDELARVSGSMKAAMERCDPEMRFEFRIVRPDGAIRSIECSARFFYGPAGNPLRMVGVNVDVTERREILARIEKKEAHLRGIVDAATASGVGIVRADSAGRILEANDAFYLITGGERKSDLSQQADWLAVDLDRVPSALSDDAQRRRAVSFERVCTRPDGTRVPVLISGQAAPGFRDDLLWFILDLSEQKKTEAELRIAKEAAEGASRAKDHFLATLSHELRTPLAPVVPLVDHLLHRSDLSESAKDDLLMVRRNIALQTRLIDDLLDLTRVGKGKLELRQELIDLHALLEKTLMICSPAETAAKGLTVELDLKADGARVWGDPVRIQQVFWNLLSNACKFSNPGGRIVVRAAMADPGHACVEVQDYGRGISAELAPRLFTPFEQGERRSADERRGLGLGLAISKALVEAHKGRISVYSPGLGHGAMFRVELPALDLPGAVVSHPIPDAAQAEIVPAFDKRVLLVEDHVDTALVMERLLRSRGYYVERVGTKATALQAGRAGEFDVLVSDIGLPDGSGHEIMEELGRSGKVCGIALSGFGSEEDIRRSHRAGFSAHLVKPVDFEELLRQIETHSGGVSGGAQRHAESLAPQS